MKKLFAIMLAALLVLSLWACKEEPKDEEKVLITQDQAIDAALNHAGYSRDDVTSIHVHMGQHEGTTIYSIHFTGGDQSHTVVVDGYTSQILDIDDPHGH